MKHCSILLLLLVLSVCGVQAQTPEVFREKGYTLNFINQDPSFDPAVKARLIKTFFEVYPVLVDQYNKASIKEVTFFVDTTYKAVAEAGGGRVRFSPGWFKAHPGDIDVVTHEVMHLVQSYPHRAGPGWLTEGIADYVRYAYGVDNQGAGWSLPAYAASQHYTNAYRVTARFLLWLEKDVKPGLVKTLDNAMRTNAYTDGIWSKQTGKSLDDLWQAYAAQAAKG
ncbi:basic secretory family protein [Parachryseolinea silvisoli]|uniref:basic secretory family protein n=1 Tax=Parachryseolinea silvisoli TaxID=2873601 RepID=UPI002265908D|nr:basic secretory family protein [Parachryseolinea silvisoli]MCD9017202.1 basic secretory family protein [Parachryseolinea silvisoli]